MLRSQPKKHNLSKHRSEAEKAAAVLDLTAKLDYLTETFLPKQPYLLSVPSDVPYRHSSRFVNTWYNGTPFHEEEEQIQYLSFLPHQGEHEELLRVTGEWCDEQGNLLDYSDSPFPIYTSGRNTPLDHSQRKKISLKDYKVKEKLSQEGEQEPQEVTEQVENNLYGKEEKQDLNSNSESKSPRKHHTDKMESPVKRPVIKQNSNIQADGARSPQSPSMPNINQRSPRPAKRRKLSPPTEGLKLMVQAEKKHIQEPSPRRMPKLLSPTLPSPEREDGLPQLLSPLLPPTLLKAIATPPPSTSAEGKAHQRSDSVRSVLANAIGDNSPSANNKKNMSTGQPSGNRIRSDSQHSTRSDASGNISTKTTAKTSLKPSTPIPSASRSPGPRQRHIITLKYGKKNRKRVEALLKFAARPKKITPAPETLSTTAFKGTKQSLTSETIANTEQKRSREESPGQTSKKLKLMSAMVGAKTPVPQNGSFTKDHNTPNTPQVSVTKSAVSTPRKELKSTAMRRVESTDGGNPSTPGDKARGSTPLSTDRSSAVAKTSPGPTSAPSARDEDRQAWNKINTKYFALGRTIKHEATSLGASPAAEADEKESARHVVLLVEALLCFIINLSALSHNRPRVDPGWSTIIPYHIFVFKASRKLPHLHGLVIQLGAVCRRLIHQYDMERLAREPIPDENYSAPTPGSDGTTKTHEDSERHKKKYIDFRDNLVKNARELQEAWLEGSRHLSSDVLEHEYPKTWSKRAKDTSHRGLDKPNPTGISKNFYLPLDATTTAFEAVRFSLAMLAEWTAKEGIEWKTRVEL